MGSFHTIHLEGVPQEGGDCPKEETEFRSGKCVCRLLLFNRRKKETGEGRKAKVGLEHEGLSGSLPPGYSPRAHCLTPCLPAPSGWLVQPSSPLYQAPDTPLFDISPPPTPPPSRELWPARWEKRGEAWNNVDTSMGILKL